MRILVIGEGHLARTHCRAAQMRGFVVRWTGPMTFNIERSDLILSAQDVEDHGDLREAEDAFHWALTKRDGIAPVVVLSQLPPGTTRRWAGAATNVFYQVDTIIVRDALRRAYSPEQIVVGCADPAEPLPLAYQEYLLAHDCPVLQMSYESAELAKCMINYALARQIEVAREGAVAAATCGADWEDVAAALRNDARIGPRAYLRPGRTNRHLDRDAETVRKLATRDGYGD